jgi:hypothetical protein
VPTDPDFNNKFGNIFSLFKSGPTDKEKAAEIARVNKQATDEFMLLFVQQTIAETPVLLYSNSSG